MFKSKFAATLLGAAVIASLSGCASVGGNLQADGITPIGMVPVAKPTPTTLDAAGMPLNAQTVFVPAKFVASNLGKHNQYANALFIHGKRVGGGDGTAYPVGFIDAPYGYVVMVNHYGTDCDGKPLSDAANAVTGHNGWTANYTDIAEYNKDGDKIKSLACIRGGVVNPSFSKYDIWYGDSAKDYFKIGTDGKKTQVAIGADDVLPIGNDGAYMKVIYRQGMNYPVLAQLMHADGSEGVKSYLSVLKTRWTFVDKIFVNAPTLSTSSSGFLQEVVNTTSVSHQQALANIGPDAPVPSLWTIVGVDAKQEKVGRAYVDQKNSHADERFTTDLSNSIVFKNRSDERYYQAGVAHDGLRFGASPILVSPLSMTNPRNQPTYQLANGEAIKGESPYGRHYPDSGCDAQSGGAMIPFITSKGAVIYTQNNLNTGGYGFVLDGDLTKAQPTLSPDLMQEFSEKWGILPITNMVGYR